jgi:hypothetical protein
VILFGNEATDVYQSETARVWQAGARKEMLRGDGARHDLGFRGVSKQVLRGRLADRDFAICENAQGGSRDSDVGAPAEPVESGAEVRMAVRHANRNSDPSGQGERESAGVVVVAMDRPEWAFAGKQGA